MPEAYMFFQGEEKGILRQAFAIFYQMILCIERKTHILKLILHYMKN